MGIVSVTELWSGREGGYNLRLQRKYTRVFQVVVDDAKIDPIDVEFAPGIPRANGKSVYVAASGRIDAGSLADDVRARQDTENPFVWTVTVGYNTMTRDPKKTGADGGSGGGSGNSDPIVVPPWNKPVLWRYGAIHDRKIIEKTIEVAPTTSRKIVNSVGQPFNPRVEVDVTRQTLTAIKNEMTFEPSSQQFYFDRVNSAVWMGYPSRRVKVQSITAEEAYENNYHYFVVTRTFEVRYPDWDAHPLDVGPAVLVNNVPTPVTNGLPTGGDVLLDGAGNKLAAGADPYTHTFKTYEEIDFNNAFHLT